MLWAMRVVFVFALLVGLIPAQELSPNQLLKNAIDAQQRGDFEAAIRDYHKVLELRPDTVEAKVNLGAALVRVGRFDEAIAMYRSALPSVPQKNAVLMNLALAYYKKGDFENAREQLEAVHKAQPNDVRAAILLGDTYVRLGKFDAAVALLEPLEDSNSQNLDFEYVLGSALIQSGRRRDGVSRVEKVAESGTSADAYMLAGITLSHMNEFDQARRDLDAALRLNPKLPGIYTLAGIARDKTGDAKQSEPAFREALKINPDDFDANLYLGAILYKRREMDEAKIYLDRALRLNPTSSMARYEVAMFKSTSGQYETAAQDLEKLVKDDPKWLDPHVELASLYYRLHRPEDGAKERQIVERLAAEQQAKGPGT
jgi:tetratricopeptide (TPR) repeat protein